MRYSVESNSALSVELELCAMPHNAEYIFVIEYETTLALESRDPEILFNKNTEDFRFAAHNEKKNYLSPFLCRSLRKEFNYPIRADTCFNLYVQRAFGGNIK
jgi:hypothetical protein